MKNNKPLLGLALILLLSACSNAQKSISENESSDSHAIRSAEQVLSEKVEKRQQTSKQALSDESKQHKLVEEHIRSERDQVVDMEVLSMPDIAPALPREKLKQESYAPHHRHIQQQHYSHQQHSVLSGIRQAQQNLDRENYAHFVDNPLRLASEHPVSTFSVDVDTAAYTNVRRILNEGQLPRADAVRIEEFINYFDYDYPVPDRQQQPFSITTEIAPTPWNRHSHLLHIGLKGYEEKHEVLPAANLVFLIDVSGSMRSADKLSLLKSSLKLLVKQLRKQDKISIVVYAGASGVVLQPTSGANKNEILNALDRLTAGGSTNGAAGIELAYRTAQQAFINHGINRILLCTDGDFNVGTVNFDALMNMIEQKRKQGVSLSTFGFGRGNLNDHLAEQLANRGNGQYSYISSLQEAQKILVDEMSSSLFTIAKDVKIQIEFNPKVVREYRLIGYVNRKLKREDFNNDKVDAGEIGAGHTVTALYEISFVGSQSLLIDELRYGEQVVQTDRKAEIGFIKLRYKKPDADKSVLLTHVLQQNQIQSHAENGSERFRFSASVAAFAQKLRGGQYLGDYSFADIKDLASNAKGGDKNGYRGELVN
ncbi:MAG: VWA domain-containing protein, partial [Gammaproteobacteria bacterium]|nr:VWA domain-containing protein [Gammaproteobacteria bacterium]